MIYVGVAGWSLGGAVKSLFGEGQSHLARYATRFCAVEINSSFYRPHRAATYTRWAASVPEDFRFSVKLPRAITHQARLKDSAALLDEFQAQVAGLGTKLGAILVQLPPSLTFAPKLTEEFFTALRARFPGPLALEPRHASWFAGGAEPLMKQFDIARVAADPAPAPEADVPGGARNPRYFRWHGSPVMYRSNYDDARLAGLAAILKPGDWCIFDNTADGAAIPNALALREKFSAGQRR